MFKLITNAWNHPMSTLQGVVEASGLTGLQVLVGDPHTLKITLGLAAWRFAKGLMSSDVRKVVEEVVGQ